MHRNKRSPNDDGEERPTRKPNTGKGRQLSEPKIPAKTSARSQAASNANVTPALVLDNPPSTSTSSDVPTEIPFWDPENSPDWDKVDMSAEVFNIIYNEIKSFMTTPVKDDRVFFHPFEPNIHTMHLIMIGPEDTPYEGGIFIFCIRFPPDYPNQAPRIKLFRNDFQVKFHITKMQFGGKIDLPLLRRNQTTSWTPACRIDNIIDEIRKVFSEPVDFSQEPFPSKIDDIFMRGIIYVDTIRYITLKYAVCENLENLNQLPSFVQPFLLFHFDKHRSKFLEITEQKNLDGKFCGDFGLSFDTVYDMSHLRVRIENIYNNHLDEIKQLRTKGSPMDYSPYGSPQHELNPTTSAYNQLTGPVVLFQRQTSNESTGTVSMKDENSPPHQDISSANTAQVDAYIQQIGSGVLYQRQVSRESARTVSMKDENSPQPQDMSIDDTSQADAYIQQIGSGVLFQRQVSRESTGTVSMREEESFEQNEEEEGNEDDSFDSELPQRSAKRIHPSYDDNDDELDV